MYLVLFLSHVESVDPNAEPSHGIWFASWDRVVRHEISCSMYSALPQANRKDVVRQEPFPAGSVHAT